MKKDKDKKKKEITDKDLADNILFRVRCKRCGKVISLLYCDFDYNESPICKNGC